MKLSREEVLHIARLSRLGLSEEEVTKFSRQLSDILGHFEILQQVDTEGVPPTAQPLPLTNVMEDDKVTASSPKEDILANAPDREDDFVKIRAVLDQI